MMLRTIGGMVALGCLFGCGDAKVKKLIRVDGSSTVYPITEAVAEEFKKETPNVEVTVGIAGTGGGFKKIARGEIDIVDASRPLKASEEKLAQEGCVELVSFTVALDGLAVVTNKENNFVDCLTVGELKKIWNTGSKVATWKDVRKEWPAINLSLFGPGADSGTFDYFTEAINGKEKASRTDFTASQDDNTLVQGVIGSKGGLGYFGYAYYAGNSEKLKLIGVDNGSGCVRPDFDTVETGIYKPLSRSLFIYVSKKELSRPEDG